MSSHRITTVQLWAWMFTGLSAPLAMIAAECGWMEVLAMGAVCIVASGLILQKAQGIRWSKWICVAQIVWIVIVLGMFCRWVDESWPVGAAYPAVPIILIVLAAMAASGGAEKAARVGCILFWGVLLISIGLICVGAADVNWEYVQSVGTADNRLVPILLSTALAIHLPMQGRSVSWKAIAGIIIFAVLISVLVSGSLSAEIAGEIDNPLHEWVRGLSIAGTPQRFEAVASVALTVGWFVYMAYLLGVIGQMAETVKGKDGKRTVWISAGIVIASLFSQVWIQIEAAAVGCFILWIAVPALYAVLVKNKFKKTEKSS